MRGTTIAQGKPWWRRDAPIFALAAALLGLYLWNLRPPPPLKGWDATYEEALVKAEAEDKQVLLAFSMRSCPPCLLMERRVLPSGPVVEALKGYVPVKVDLPSRPELAERYGVYAAPTYVVTDARGEPVARTEGSTPAKEFAAFLSIAAESRGKAGESGSSAPDVAGRP